MTNLQDVADSKASLLQQRLLLGVPIGVGALVTALVVGLAVVPQWMRLQADSERLAQLEELKARIPLLRAQIAKTAETQSSAERKQRQVLQLIEGSGELVTFLAQLDREATRHGVQLDLYEPVAAPPPVSEADAKKDAKKGGQPAPPPQSPLEAAGLKAQKVLLTAKGPYPNLLAFLRATERLSVLMSQSNLALAVVAQPQTAQPSAPAPGQPGASVRPVAAAKTELKLMFTYYRSGDGVAPAPATPKS